MTTIRLTIAKLTITNSETRTARREIGKPSRKRLKSWPTDPTQKDRADG